MAFLQPAAKLVFGGSLLTNSSEIWSCSMGVWSPSGSGTLARAATIAPAISDFVKSAGANINSGCQLTYVKLNAIGPDGKYLDQANTNEYYFPESNLPKGSGQRINPPQCSLAVSLGTSASRGLASRGRFYLPMPSHEVTSAGTIFTSAIQPTADAAVNMINVLNGLLGGGYRISVLSEKGRARQVTRVQVGNVMDTQRRRRNKLEERYVVAAVDPNSIDPGQAEEVFPGPEIPS